jgi:hypothetical protein
MRSTTIAPPPSGPDSRSRRNDREGSTATVGLSTRRVNVMRFGYAFMGLGLVIVKWPILVQDARSLPVMEGVVTCLLTGLSLLALLGLRYPVRMLPILLFEVIWKVLWLGAVAIPRLAADDTNPAFDEVLFNCSFIVIIFTVIPWRYVVAEFVTKPGDPWREGR